MYRESMEIRPGRLLVMETIDFHNCSGHGSAWGFPHARFHGRRATRLREGFGICFCICTIMTFSLGKQTCARVPADLTQAPDGGGRLREIPGRVSMRFYKRKPNENIAKICSNQRQKALNVEGIHGNQAWQIATKVND